MRKVTLVSLLLATSVPTAFSYELVQRAFDINVSRSDVVVVGVAISERHEIEGDTSRREYVTILIRNVFKGSVADQVEFLVTPEDIEFDPRCCVLGATYLLVLEKIGPGQYETVNGRYGAQKLNLG